MNPLEWEDVLQRLGRPLDQNASRVNNNMGKALRTNHECLSYTVDARHSSTEVDMEWEELSPKINNFDSRESEVENPDGEPLQVEEDLLDLELARKHRELREIEQQILFKKAAIALKTVTPGISCKGQLTTCNGKTLRDRVTLILQERNSHRNLPKLCSPKRRTNSSLLVDHPLKLRVKALMKLRCCDAGVLPVNTQVPDITPPPPTPPPPPPPSPPHRQNVISPAKEESNDNIGFQRFLSVLNKGVDIDLLSRIVNDDSEELAIGEDLLMVHPPAVEDKSKLTESRPSHSAASLTDCSLTTSQKETPNNIPSLCGDEEEKEKKKKKTKKNDRRDDSPGFKSRSKSPPAVKKKKPEKEMPKAAVQQEQLQNILKTLGLNLEIEELSKLTDRTQERLYGKKNEHEEVSDVRQERESRHKGSKRLHRNSSSESSSSSSSSRFTSQNFSPARCQSSRSRDTKQGRVSEYSSSGDGSHNSEAALTQERIDPKETSAYQYQYSQEQTQSHPHPPACPTFTDYSLYSEYAADNTDASSSYSAYTQTAAPPAPDPSKYPYPPITEHYFPRRSLFEDINLLVNPDLSTSEGQSGSRQRCLRVIKPNQATHQRCLKKLTKRKGKARYIAKCRKWFFKMKQRRKKGRQQCSNPVQNNGFAVQMLQASQEERGDIQTEPKEEKRPHTEEEIKMNLRRKLEAFNQRAKQQVPQPSRSLTAQTESVDNLLESQP